jgi:hypothetical protein
MAALKEYFVNIGSLSFGALVCNDVVSLAARQFAAPIALNRTIDKRKKILAGEIPNDMVRLGNLLRLAGTCCSVVMREL